MLVRFPFKISDLTLLDENGESAVKPLRIAIERRKKNYFNARICQQVALFLQISLQCLHCLNRIANNKFMGDKTWLDSYKFSDFSCDIV